MSAEVISTIEVLAGKVKAKEEEANKLKKIINELCLEEGIPPRYENVADAAGASASVRRDQFYGYTITSAARTYLEIRKAANMGATSVDEIYKAIRDGGYKFETKIEENAKTALRSALRKTSSIFHRLPTGDYGLLAWYPNAKAVKSDDGDDDHTKRGKKPKKAAKKPAGTEPGTPAPDYVTNDAIRDAIFKMEGNFGAGDIEKRLKETFPTKAARDGAISSLIFSLKEGGFIKIVSERKGKIGAQYCKA